ncbi:MAG: hypothetical protein ABI548_04970 [Polyangiaceae bacterium]
MQNTSIKRSALFVAGALGLAGAFFAGAAYASDPKLQEAADLITKATAALQSATAPDGPKEFGGHRHEAVQLLTRAQAEILKAQQFADAHPAPPVPKTPKPPVSKDPKPPTPKP